MFMLTKGKKILIADDEPDILEIIQYNLVKEGYEVITAKDGDEALVKAKNNKPDLIIIFYCRQGQYSRYFSGQLAFKLRRRAKKC